MWPWILLTTGSVNHQAAGVGTRQVPICLTFLPLLWNLTTASALKLTLNFFFIAPLWRALSVKFILQQSTWENVSPLWRTVCSSEVSLCHWSSFPFHSCCQEALSQIPEFNGSRHNEPYDCPIRNLLFSCPEFLSLAYVFWLRTAAHQRDKNINRRTNLKSHAANLVPCEHSPPSGSSFCFPSCLKTHPWLWTLSKKRDWLPEQCKEK